MMTHTPGPWEVEHSDGGRVQVVTVRGSVIARINSWFHAPRRKAEVHENAHLIAAAPELLEACKEAAQWFASYRPTYRVEPVTRSPTDIADSLKAAIAKAEGAQE